MGPKDSMGDVGQGGILEGYQPAQDVDCPPAKKLILSTWILLPTNAYSASSHRAFNN